MLTTTKKYKKNSRMHGPFSYLVVASPLIAPMLFGWEFKLGGSMVVVSLTILDSVTSLIGGPPSEIERKA
jgi:hypothetical protein